jgi:hypothetical protein
VRYENQLLSLAIRLRAELDALRRRTEYTPKPLSELLLDDNDGFQEGVFKEKDLPGKLVLLAKEKGLDAFANTKVMAWRNKTVDHYNDLIRQALGFTQEYHVGEYIRLGSPLTSLVNGKRTIVATVDEEYVIQGIEDKVCNLNEDLSIPVPNLQRVPYYELRVEGGLTINVTPKDDYALEENLEVLARLAKGFKAKLDFKQSGGNSAAREAARTHWKYFWNLHAHFTKIRYGYALTAHRAQGSTFDITYVVASDIMANPDAEERIECLHVTCTRATTSIHFM